MEEIQLKLNKSSLSGGKKKKGLRRNERAVGRVKLLGN